jgi:hypothetical protein
VQPQHFDRVTKLLADRRVSRRKTAAGLMSTSPANAQDATPAPSDKEKSGQFLFVQSFQSGRIEPKPSEPGVWTLTLEQGLGQTIYFSNRPERIVGAAPTDRFLAGLGFPEDNPPNAALLFNDPNGNEDITVVTLLNPLYDTSTNTATYDVQWLSEYQRLDMEFQTTPEEPAEAGATFGAAHLFIDDCPDSDIVCVHNACSTPWKTGESQYCDVRGVISNAEHDGYCYSWSAWACLPCEPRIKSSSDALTYWTQMCNGRFPLCQGGLCKPYPIYL